MKMTAVHRSKLEIYESILEALIDGPSSFESIAYETCTDCRILNERMEFLLDVGLIELRDLGEKGGYAITERGVAVLKVLSFQKYLQRITNKLGLIDDALEMLSNHTEDREERDP